MNLIFTKGSGKFDVMQVIAPDSAVQYIDCPKQGIIPHDMVHFAVESSLHKRGFVARVVAGEAAVYQMSAEPEAEAVERLVEVFQADGWSGWNSAPEAVLDLYQVTCNARQNLPLALNAEDIQAVRMQILALTAQWQATPVGESLTLQF